MATERQSTSTSEVVNLHHKARELAVDGRHDESIAILRNLIDKEGLIDSPDLLNDLGVLDALHGRFSTAEDEFQRALTVDPGNPAAIANLAMINGHLSDVDVSEIGSGNEASDSPPKVAVVSLLFNWPSTGGGTIHTKECAEFLQRAGYDVRHFYAKCPEWGVGNVTDPLNVSTAEVTFDSESWKPATIRSRFRAALDDFTPDYVIITDSWNTKPLLAEAAAGYPYFLRIAALECICPLNNVRLLVADGSVRQCQANQLQDPMGCQWCVRKNQHLSGDLHQAERFLAEFDDTKYSSRLLTAIASANGVLVVNRQIAELVRPFAQKVEVVPSGFDADRFPAFSLQDQYRTSGRQQIFFAGLVQEFMKGFSVLQAAGRELWSRRQDFEFVVTADPSGSRNEFTRFIGWQSQAALPQRMAEADIVVFPTIAQEALGRSAVEAMGCGRPVIASRIGGLPEVVDDEQTGLLVEPGNAGELAAAIERLLDDRPLRENMGRAGREKFQREYTWDVIIQRHYQRLFGDPVLAGGSELISTPSRANGAKNDSVTM